jgi:N-acetylneuraminic acid mutarotase
MKRAFAILISVISFFGAEGQTWQAVQYANGTSPLQRHENGFVEVNGKFYLIGGRGVKNVNIFDPATRIWTSGAAPPIELHHFQAVVYQNRIYAICALTGGYPAETPVDRIYIYDPSINTWSQGATIPVNRRRGSAGVALHNNKFYIVAGIQDGHRSGWVPWTDEYDPVTGIWTTLPDAPQARDHFHVGVINGKIYCAGGRRTSQPNFAANTLSNVDVFDIATRTWSTPTQIPTPSGAPAIAVVNNELIVAGGEVDYQSTALSTVQSYNPVTNVWTARPNLNVGRHATQFINYTGNLYIAAGSTTMGGSGENNTMAFATFSTPANTPPVVSQPYPNQTVPNTQTSLVIQLGQVFSDNGGINNLTFSVPSNTNAALISSTQIVGSQLTFTLSGTTGTGVITLRATDAGNASVQTTFQLTVTTSSGTPQLVNLIRINSGGPAQTFGSESWIADQYFSGGTAYSTVSPIGNTTQDQIYQTERFGNFSYAIPVGQAGTYAVDFHLAEIYFGTAGQRVFNINVENGQFVRNNLDLIQTYGARNTANVLRADNLNITDGTINITFTNVVNNAKISGISVGRYSSTPPTNMAPVVSQAPAAQSVPNTQPTVVLQLGQIFSDDGGVNNLTFAVPNNTNQGLFSNTQIAGTQLTFTLSGTTGSGMITIRATDASNAFVQTTFQLTVTSSGTPALTNVIRINSGGTAQNFNGEAWIADQYFTGGTGYSTNSPIANTTQDQVYQSERFGNFNYAIPVGQAGTYAVDIHLAEIYFGQAGQRVFNINIENGLFVRNNLDLIQTYGANNTANVLRADNLNITDGTINIVFTTVVNNAKVSGISVGRYVSGGGGGTPDRVTNLIKEVSQASFVETSNSEIIVYPNPANRKITVKLNTEYVGSCDFILTDAQGRQVSLGLYEITAKHQSIEFDLDHFGIGHGLHYLQIHRSGKNESKKLMIK